MKRVNMTMCVAIATSDFVGLVTDRRLTNGNNDAGKCGSVTFQHGKFLYSFAGLAEYKSFKTREWLAESMVEAGHQGVPAMDALKNLAALVTLKFASFRGLSKVESRFSLILVGFLDFSNPVRQNAAIAVISNFQTTRGTRPEASQDIDVELLTINDAPLIGEIGSGQLRDSEVQDLYTLVEKGATPPLVIGRCVDFMRAAAKREPGNTVGGDFTALHTFPSSISPPPFNYYSENLARHIPFPDYVMSKWDQHGAYILLGAELRIDRNADDNTVLRVPKVSKNRPCPCASGRRYKHCHGAMGRFHSYTLENLQYTVRYRIAKPPDEGIELMRVSGCDMVPIEITRLGGPGGAADILWRGTLKL